MNEILKFKQGRKVLSAKFGDNFRRVGTASNGLSGIYFNPDDNQLWKGGLTGYSRIGDTYSYYSGLGGGVIKASDYIEKPKAEVTKRTSSNPGEIVVNGKRYASKADWVKEQRAQREQQPLEVVITGRAGKRPASKVTPRGQGYWDKQYQDFLGKMTDDLKAWLALRGIDYNSAQQMQTYLANHGQDLGKWGADGKWAGASQAAWDNFVATTMKNNPLQTPVKDQPKAEPVVDAPDPFGYKTSNTYEGDDFANKLKGMGIRSNADLINFMHNSGKAGWKGDAWQTQFRSDVDKALGGDYSDANIRKTFHTKNGWGGGFLGGGDFTDFQNALQTNAGAWNGAYELKQNDARMDAARQQYATKMAQQYTELNPVQLTAPKKFTIGSGIGANTLGDAGAGTMNNQKQLPYADK